MKKTLKLGLFKPPEIDCKPISLGLPSKIASSVSLRVKESTMETFSDLNNSFENKYEILEIIGEGCTGLVRKCVNKETKELLAVKIVRTNEIEILKAVKEEFMIQSDLDHDNIVKVFEMFFNPIASRIQIIMELIQGNELSECVCTNGPFSGIII